MNLRRVSPTGWLLAGGFAAVTALVLWIGHEPATAPAGTATLDAGGMENVAYAGMAAAQTAALPPVTGNWTGSVTVGRTQIRMDFFVDEHDGQLTGKVRFPVGDGLIQSGSRHNDKIAMETLNHVPSNGQALLTRFNGTYTGDALQLTMITENGSDALMLHRMP